METNGMARRSKREYLRSIQQRYQQARRAEKTAILDEFTKVCGYHRKYAMRLLHRPGPARPRLRRVPKRAPTYSEEVIRLLAQVWEASGYLCAQQIGRAHV